MTFQASFQVYAQGFQVVNIGNSSSVQQKEIWQNVQDA